MKGKSLTVIGAAISLAFSGNVAAMAQSNDTYTSAPTEIKMSPEGMKILCQHFPLNSRCPGGIPLDRGFLTPTPTPTTHLDATTVPVLPTQSHVDNSPQLTPAPLTPTEPSLNNSTYLNPIPGNSSFVEFSR